MSAAKQPIITRFTPSNQCPVCGTGSKGCSATAHGLHLCRGEPADPPAWADVSKGKEDAAGFRHHRRRDDERPGPRPTIHPTPPNGWHDTAERFATALDADGRAELARHLRLPLEALDGFPLIGWKADERCWTFPECAPAGGVVGINRRFRDGKKKVLAGGNRGLTLPAGWRERGGPVFVVEGASDVLAMTHAGLSCVGRPSNSGGADMLAELLNGWPADREIIVAGENDRKDNGDWPGRTGAEAVAKSLAVKLRRVVLVAMPRADSKDVRDWLTHPDRGESIWPDRGPELAELLTAAAERVEPPGNAPQRVRVPDYRPFPVHALPPVLREFVAEVAASVGCDPAFAALPALTLAGAAVGAALVVRVKRGYEQPPLLWLLTVGDSGTGKSPAFKPSEQLAFGIDRRLKDEHVAAVRKYAADLEAWEADECPDPEKRPHPPVRERFAVIDATIERLTVEAATSPRGLVVVRDEADGWLSSFARYKGKGGGSDVPNWLSMFEAGPVRYMRRTGEPKEVEAERAFVAVCGGIQPDILKAALSDPAFVASGLVARLGFAMPPKACPKWSDRELSADTERAFADVLDSLRKLPFDPRNGPGRVNLDVAALARFKRVNNEFAATAEDLDGGPMAAVLPKAVRFALRLALVWQCVSDAAAGRDPGRGSVSDEAMSAGEELARWFVHEAARVYAMLAERPEDRFARTLAEWVRRKGGRVRPRDLQRSNGTKYPTTEAAELALDALVTAGFGEWVEDPPKAGGGRPGRVFVLTRTPPSDTRQNPTEPPCGSRGQSDPAPDTTPDHHPAKCDFPEGSEVVSGFVGCRVGTATAPADENAPPRTGEVVSDARPEPWEDAGAFFAVMKRAGWTWRQVLAWLNAPLDAGFFAVGAELRKRAADHLRTLPTVGRTSGG